MREINSVSAQVVDSDVPEAKQIKVGLLINFTVLHLKDGRKRMVNKLEPSASLRALRG
jgi:hypothetical protein